MTSERTRLAEAAAGVLATALALGLTASAGAGAAPSSAPAGADRAAADELSSTPRVASYTLSARLDDGTHVIDGKGVIELSNHSRASLRELYLHLYLNAFKHEKSLFLRSPFGEGRGGARADDWGFIDVKSLRARELEGVDLWPSKTNGSPEEPDDETDVRVTLPRPLEPGARLTLDVEFSAKLPRIVLRTGYSGDFHFAGQWFPKLARLTPDGAFVHFPFHPQAEFHADYGSYDVTLDVPSTMTIGATGRRVEAGVANGRRRERYRADAVHDFAWTAWAGFREETRAIDGVSVRVLYPEGHERNARTTLGAIEVALPRASSLYGRYPYSTLTVVHPPDHAAQAGGMEYPTLITTGGPWFAGLAGDRAIEAVTVHELLHQWFYGIVGSDEARFPFLDEGVTSYAEHRMLEAGWGPGSIVSGLGLSVSAAAVGRLFALERAEDAPVALPASQFPGFRALASLAYGRSAALFETAARVYGRARLERALGSYARRHRFGHPGPEDLVAALKAELGVDATRQLEAALHRRGRVDYVVRDLQSAPDRTPGGLFDADGTREPAIESSTVPERFRGRAVVYRHGTLELPVEIRMVDADGAVTTRAWSGQGPFTVVEHTGRAPLAAVIVDPERRVLVDENLLDNAVSLRPVYPWRTLERASYAATLALSVLGP